MKICTAKGKCFLLSLPAEARYELSSRTKPDSQRHLIFTCKLRPSSPEAPSNPERMFDWSVAGSGVEGGARFKISGYNQDGISHIEADYMPDGKGTPRHLSMQPSAKPGAYTFKVTSQNTSTFGALTNGLANLAIQKFIAPRILGNNALADSQVQTLCRDEGDSAGRLGSMGVSNSTISVSSRSPLKPVYGNWVKPRF